MCINYMLRSTFLSWFWIFFCSTLLNAVAQQQREQISGPDNDAVLMVDWLVNKHHGVFSDKIELRTVELSAGHFQDFGMFASQDIAQGESLIVIPLSTVVSSTKKSNSQDNFSDPDDDDDDVDRNCDAVHNMVHEYEKGTQSNYHPYMRYIFEGYGNIMGMPVNTWSSEGRDVFFDTVIGEELFPSRGFVEQNSYRRECEQRRSFTHSIDDRKQALLLEQAYTYFWARRRWDAIVPFLDMIPHRNGFWHNVDGKTVKEQSHLLVYARRNIQAGEQLFTSLNECEHLGCDGLKDSYLTQHIFAHFGVIEDYPRRWLIETDPDDETFDLIIDVDQVTDSGGLEKSLAVHWRTSLPSPLQMNFIRAQLHRLKAMNETVNEKVVALTSIHERDFILNYYAAYKEALQAAWDNRKGDTITGSTPPDARTYDTFSSSKRRAVVPPENFAVCSREIQRRDERTEIEWADSLYQTIRFTYSTATDDTALSLASWLQTASSIRPHYHDSLIHVPAQYVKQVKRVVYLGGGDNMILYELMKYKDLELVVGLELDQKVSRLSFKHFGSLPYFDDPRVQWWFGDASKSLLALPDDYFGSFDLVIVDLLTYVADVIKVTDSMTIMDTASLLMKPDGGVIVRNEDFSIRSNTAFAKFTVELEYQDDPFLCEQSVTIGSDSVDFVHTLPTDHGVHTLARPLFSLVKRDLPIVGPFDAWNKYHRVSAQICDEVDKSSDQMSKEDVGQDRNGVLMIIEAEYAIMAELSEQDISDTFKSFAEKHGLAGGSLVKSILEPNTFIYAFNSGYIVARIIPKWQYVALDLALWEHSNSLVEIGNDLVTAVGGNDVDSSSTFVIVTGGMPVRLNMNHTTTIETLGLRKKRRICQETLQSCENPSMTGKNLDSVIVYDQLLAGMLTKKDDTSSTVVVLCGLTDNVCDASKASSAVSIRPCSSFDNMSLCEDETLKVLHNLVATTSGIDALILDKSMPLEMGQVIHRILNETRNYDNIVAPEFLVVSPVAEDEEWKGELVDRFRTEIVIFDPALRAEFLLSNGSQNFRWTVFSTTKRQHFFQRLTQTLTSVVEKSSFESFEVLEVENGMKTLVADFRPTSAVISDKDYDKVEAAKRWKSQVPVAYQFVIQTTVDLPRASLEVGEKVLFLEDSADDTFNKVFDVGTVISKVSDKEYLVKGFYEDDPVEIIDRESIRKISLEDNDVSRRYKPGDVILFDNESDGLYHNGVVEERTGDDVYNVYLLDYQKTQLTNIPGKQLLFEAESKEYAGSPPPLKLPVLLDAFDAALAQSRLVVDKSQVERKFFPLVRGNMEFAIWPGGTAVMTWDGNTGVVFNVFIEKEDPEQRIAFQKAFLDKVPSSKVIALDEFPRGFGKVINLKKEMESPPRWLHEYDNET